VHRSERVVNLRRHRSTGKEIREQFSKDGDRMIGIGKLPAHDHHEREAEEQKAQRGQTVLNSDHLVIDGENVLSPEPKLMMAVPLIMIMVAVVIVSMLTMMLMAMTAAGVLIRHSDFVLQ
jgi:hypothetical protein